MFLSVTIYKAKDLVTQVDVVVTMHILILLHNLLINGPHVLVVYIPKQAGVNSESILPPPLIYTRVDSGGLPKSTTPSQIEPRVQLFRPLTSPLHQVYLHSLGWNLEETLCSSL